MKAASAAAPDRRTADRRVSPAVGEWAILECARLRASNAELVEALRTIDRLAYSGEPGIGFIARAAIAKAAPDFHDDKPEERADRHVTTQEGDLDTFSRPMRQGS